MGSIVSSERTQSGFPCLSWKLPSTRAQLPGDSSLSWALSSSPGSRAKVSPVRILEAVCIHLTGGCRHLVISLSAVSLEHGSLAQKAEEKKKSKTLATEAGRAGHIPEDPGYEDFCSDSALTLIPYLGHVR